MMKIAQILEVLRRAYPQRIQPGVRIVEVEGPHFLLQANAKAAAVPLNNFLVRVQNAA